MSPFCTRLAAAICILVGTVASGHAATPLPAPKPEGHKRLKIDVTISTRPARDLFKKVRAPAPLPPESIGGYTKGCLAGGAELEIDGDHWQAMRLSRRRRYGHPATITLIKRLAREAAQFDGWPGLLVGDIAMARGGPMWPSHASHQIGLDADIWLTPMPDKRFTQKERESISATYMLTKDQLSINPEVWTEAHEKLLKRVASYPEVQRVLVHPAIKRQLCKTAGDDRAWLYKLRPVWGHNYHFHVRLSCPPGNTSCRPQNAVAADDGCGAELTTWYKRLHARLKPKPKPKPGAKKKPKRKRRLMTLNDLPSQCRRVLAAE